MSIDVLIGKIKQFNNPTVFGLDPTEEHIPESIWQGGSLEDFCRAVLKYNCLLIDALWDVVPAVKPQVAYYERLGYQGMKVMKDTMDYAKSKGLYVIADIKRNDIGATSKAYATAWLGKVELDGREYEPFGADGVTLNGYLGIDGINPFLEECKQGKTLFVLAKTSNPSSSELQDKLIDDGRPVYLHMAETISRWGAGLIGQNGYSQVGIVAGATYPEQLKVLRENLPNTYFLVPGYGAQGGSAKDLAGAFDKDGLGAIVNSSRAIMCAWKKTGQDLQTAARAEAVRMRDEINENIGEVK